GVAACGCKCRTFRHRRIAPYTAGKFDLIEDSLGARVCRRSTRDLFLPTLDPRRAGVLRASSLLARYSGAAQCPALFGKPLAIACRRREERVAGGFRRKERGP